MLNGKWWSIWVTMEWFFFLLGSLDESNIYIYIYIYLCRAIFSYMYVYHTKEIKGKTEEAQWLLPLRNRERERHGSTPFSPKFLFLYFPLSFDEHFLCSLIVVISFCVLGEKEKRKKNMFDWMNFTWRVHSQNIIIYEWQTHAAMDLPWAQKFRQSLC